MAEAEKLIEIYNQLEDAGLMVIAGKKDTAELMVSHDVVPVVRCKDCEYRADELDCGNYLCNRKMIGMVRPNDFCSFGERRTE